MTSAKRHSEAGTLEDLDLADPYFDPVERYEDLLNAWHAASSDDRRRLLLEAAAIINEPLWLATDTPATVAMRIASQLSHGKAKLVL